MQMTITTALLDWYDAHKRTLPWRDIHDPYATWVSETMLQQTRVETVLRYYPRFLQRFPTVTALAEAPLEDVLKLWEGLGYYRRARNLHAGAQQVAADFAGAIPKDVPTLLKIHGIGAYTAGAIASIAYGQPVPAVDGNVIRVMSRVCGIRENTGIPSVQRKIAACAASFVPQERPGDFNQALMDLGATICVPGTPDCEHCPLQAMCDAHAAGDEADLPQLPDRTPPKAINYDVCLIISNGRVLMRQRTEAMLQGLWVFPMIEGHRNEPQLPAAVKKLTRLQVTNIVPQGDARHVFTHQIWQMKLYAMHTDIQDAPDGWRFVSLTDMEALTIPTAMRTAVRCAKTMLEESTGPTR